MNQSRRSDGREKQETSFEILRQVPSALAQGALQVLAVVLCRGVRYGLHAHVLTKRSVPLRTRDQHRKSASHRTLSCSDVSQFSALVIQSGLDSYRQSGNSALALNGLR